MIFSEAILRFLDNFHLLEKNVLIEVQALLKKLHVPKKTYLLKEGEVCKNFYLVEKGLFRYYFVENDGTERTTWFSKENDCLISINSFVNQKPSHDWIVALEDSDLYYLSFEDAMHLMNKYHSCSKLANMLLLYYLDLISIRTIHYQKKAAQDRYNELIEVQPDLFLRVPLIYLASYLGVTPETLSRMRSTKRAEQ